MATPLSNTFRVVSITHNTSFTIPDPIDFGFDEDVGVTETRPATRISPTVAVDSYGLKAMGKGSKAFTPQVVGTKGTLAFVLLQYDSSTQTTVSIANMIALDTHGSGSGKPHTFEQHFIYSAGNTENTAPITVS
jgi:hypothetical protein